MKDSSLLHFVKRILRFSRLGLIIGFNISMYLFSPQSFTASIIETGFGVKKSVIDCIIFCIFGGWGVVQWVQCSVQLLPK